MTRDSMTLAECEAAGIPWSNPANPAMLRHIANNRGGATALAKPSRLQSGASPKSQGRPQLSEAEKAALAKRRQLQEETAAKTSEMLDEVERLDKLANEQLRPRGLAGKIRFSGDPTKPSNYKPPVVESSRPPKRTGKGFASNLGLDKLFNREEYNKEHNSERTGKGLAGQIVVRHQNIANATANNRRVGNANRGG